MSRRRRFGLGGAAAFAAFSAASSALAAPPVVSVRPAGVSVAIESSSVVEALEALGRAAGFKVTIEGPRPTRPLYNTRIEARTPAQAVLRLLDGQNLNYGLVYAADRRIAAITILGAPPATSAPTSPPPTTTTAGSPAAPSTPPSRALQSAPQPDAVESAEPETAETPAPTPVPAPSLPAGLAPNPYGRSLGQPIGGSSFPPRQNPAPVPSPVIPPPPATSPTPAPSPTPSY